MLIESTLCIIIFTEECTMLTEILVILPSEYFNGGIL